jgi:hypothetical protein
LYTCPGDPEPKNPAQELDGKKSSERNLRAIVLYSTEHHDQTRRNGMRMTFFGLAVALGAVGCATPYKDALCRLSNGSTGVATHYAEYVNADTDADRKAARQAEATQFQQAIDEGKQQCAK